VGGWGSGGVGASSQPAAAAMPGRLSNGSGALAQAAAAQAAAAQAAAVQAAAVQAEPPPAAGAPQASKIYRQVTEATQAASTKPGLQRVHGFTQCAVKLMTEARRLERARALPQGEASSEDMWTAAANYWKQQASKSADDLEAYLVSSSCLKIAAACSMRAYRMRQQQGKESEKASSSRAAQEVLALTNEVSARIKVAGGADFSLRAAEAARVEQGLRQLASLSRAIADFDSGVVLGRSFADTAPKALRGKFPTLDNFAVISSGELIAVGESLGGLVEKLIQAESRAAEGNATPEVDDDEED
jgi:hypothetical protein